MSIAKKSVLVIDDDEVLLGLLVQEFTAAGFQSVGAKTAADAHNKVGNQKFSVILVDLQIYGQSGLRIVEQIRSSKFGFNSTTPIVLMSGHLNVETVRKAGKLVQSVLAKPFNAKDAIRQINSILDYSSTDVPKSVTSSNDIENPASKASAQVSKLVHDVSGKLMVASMLCEQLHEMLSNHQNLDQEKDLAVRLDESLKKIDAILKSASSGNDTNKTDSK